MLKGYVGITDYDWYSFLAKQPKVDEVNFWKPSAKPFKALSQGDLFFFKLKAPYNAIAGYGYFHGYEILPAGYAWELFGKMNGSEDFHTMKKLINSNRPKASEISNGGSFDIGCVLLYAPVFFPQNQWVTMPNDMANEIVSGKGYDLSSGEGRRLYEECKFKASLLAPQLDLFKSVFAVAEESTRYGNPVEILPRLGQGLFSLDVRKAYGSSCAVTHEHSTPVLEAAHIKPYSIGGEHRVDNGLLLRSDLHRLYDQGYVTVTPDHVFQVGDRLRDEFHNGKTYYALDNTKISLPERTIWQPNKEFLEWHNATVFKG